MLSQFEYFQLAKQEKSFLQSSKEGEYLECINCKVKGQAHTYNAAYVVDLSLTSLISNNLEYRVSAMKTLVDYLEPTKNKFNVDNEAHKYAWKLTQFPQSKHYSKLLSETLNKWGRN